MHYSGHRLNLTTSAVYVTMLTYASTNDQWARLACPFWSVRQITKSCQFSSVTSLCTRLNAQGWLIGNPAAAATIARSTLMHISSNTRSNYRTPADSNNSAVLCLDRQRHPSSRFIKFVCIRTNNVSFCMRCTTRAARRPIGKKHERSINTATVDNIKTFWTDITNRLSIVSDVVANVAKSVT